MVVSRNVSRAGSPMSAAERMRRYRARRRQLGLHAVTRWEATGGGPPRTPAYSSHRILEARSLAMHCLIARKIDERPALLRVARQNLRRWKRRAGREKPSYLGEWATLLEKPWPEVASVITELSERGARLRQSSPFAGVLTPAERRRIYEAFGA